MSKVPATQADKFKTAARTLGCDESEEAFDQKLRVIARQKPRADVKDSHDRYANTAARTKAKNKS
jgi:hypothetical protein